MSNILPVNKGELFEIRMHSIGGQGAYTTGQMIATQASSIKEIRSAIFASYGSEKKGAPVNVFVRFLESHAEITNFSAVKTPNIVVVFHESLLKTQNVLEGMKADGILIVNTDLEAQELIDKYELAVNKVLCVDGTKIAVETKAKINTVMYGAILKVLEFISIKDAEKMIESKLSYKYPHLVASNIKATLEGYERAELKEITSRYERIASKFENRLGYKTQIPGGIILGANAQKIDRSISREGYLPKFNKEACINCTKCDLTCPDDCFVWKEVEGRRGRMQMELQGIDYDYCKGCLRCVQVCPTEALTEAVEERDYAENNTVSHEYNKEVE